MTAADLAAAIQTRLACLRDTSPDDPYTSLFARARRDVLRELQFCINGLSHGKATHNEGASAARSLADVRA